MDEFEEKIADALGIYAFSYNSDVTNEVWGVMRLLRENESIFCTDIACELGLKPSHVELIQYLICNNDHAEYGTSPRGCWLTKKGEKLVDELAAIEAREREQS